MKIYYCEQYSDEWVRLRLGIPTASEFHRIITAVKGELSKSAPKYAYALVAETLLGRPLERQEVNTWAMQRGRDLEPAAADQYAFLTDCDFHFDPDGKSVGFVTTDDGRVGCSPDRLVQGATRPEGGCEIKCTLDEHHMGIWVDGPGDDYRQQYEGSLWVADELEWWDLHAFHPALPPSTPRMFRDPGYQTKLGAALGQFLEMRDAMLAKAIASGFFGERAAVAAGEIPTPVGAGPALDALFGLDTIQAGEILRAGKQSSRRKSPKMEPDVSARLAALAKAFKTPEPIRAPVAAPIAETPPATAPAGKTPTAKQTALLALLTRAQGANRKEMLSVTGAKSGASPETCKRLAKAFGYIYVQSKRTGESPTSYRLIRDSGAD